MVTVIGPVLYVNGAVVVPPAVKVSGVIEAVAEAESALPKTTRAAEATSALSALREKFFHTNSLDNTFSLLYPYGGQKRALL